MSPLSLRHIHTLSKLLLYVVADKVSMLSMSACFRYLSTLCQRRRSTLNMLWRQLLNCLTFTIIFLKLTTPLKNLVSIYTLPILFFFIMFFLSSVFTHLCILPFSLSDLVAIPDFLAGAMENWGLITFRETTLLVGSESSPLEKQVVASVIAHELAHQVVLFAFMSMLVSQREYVQGPNLCCMFCCSGLETW